MKEGAGRWVESTVEGQNAHERGVGWPLLFLGAKRIPGDGVSN
jgi:hypothetical protein